MTSHRPLIVGLSGAGSNCGKTSLVCALIKHFKSSGSVAALKVSTSTPDHRCGRTGLPCSCLKFDGQMRLLEGKEYTERPGKDTYQMAQAGADLVWWMQTTSDFSKEAATHTLKDAPDADIWIIEGGAFVREELVDIGVAVCRYGDEPSSGKPGFSEAAAKAHFQVRSLPKSRSKSESDSKDEKPPVPAPEPDVLVFDPEGGEVPGPLIDEIKRAMKQPHRIIASSDTPGR